MLHILNGDGLAAGFREARLPGEVVVWREALALGPTPSNVEGDEWTDLRAAHLSETYEQDILRCKNTLHQQEHDIERFAEHEETVFWFEFDLFCQINLIYLLNWFSNRNLSGRRLSLVCIDRFPGIDHFRGLGQLEPKQLALLFDERRPVTQTILRLASEAWRAYTSPNPTEIESLLRENTSNLPFLQQAFLAHLARFPSLRSGLGRVEKVLLDLVVGGIDEFKPLFHMFLELEPLYGFGDWQIWAHLRTLAAISDPLITIHHLKNANRPLISGEFMHAYFRITSTGKAILVGNSDMLNRNDIDFWLGGVHLNRLNSCWRWDETNAQLVQKDF